MAFIDIHDIGQIGTVFGIVAILITTFFQLRSYKKDQREQQEKSRAAITAEINSRAEELLQKIEFKLEPITTIRSELNELKSFVFKMDDNGTVEWRKTRPFIVEKINKLEKRIEELEEK